MAPSLLSERLVLQLITSDDIALIHEGLSDPEITRYYGVHFDTIQQTEEQMRWYDSLHENETGLWWKVVTLHENQFIGACGFNDVVNEPEKQAEIGCWLLTDFQGFGYATEALKKIIHYGFDVMQLDCIYGEVFPDNKAVVKTLKKLGFKNKGSRELIDFKTDDKVINHRYMITP